jgi:hypothetical protein
MEGLRAKGLKDVIGFGNAVERVDGTGVARVEFRSASTDAGWDTTSCLLATIHNSPLVFDHHPGSKIHVCFQN